MLAKGLRDDFMVGKFDLRFRERFGVGDHLSLMRVSSVSVRSVCVMIGY